MPLEDEPEGTGSMQRPPRMAPKAAPEHAP